MREMIKMSYDPDNIFARILAGELPCHKIYEDEHTFSFLDIMPRAKGHTLVLPKAQVVNLLDVDDGTLCHLMRTVRKLAPVIKQAVAADGLLIQQFNGAAAGQTVFHMHVHIVPRFEGVPLKHHASEPQQEAILAENARIIRGAVEQAFG